MELRGRAAGRANGSPAAAGGARIERTRRHETDHRLRRIATLSALGGLAFGLALHYLVLYARDHGPSAGSWSLQGSGAISLIPLGALIVLVAEIQLVRRRAWVGAIFLPVATFLGLFVLVGTV